MFRSCLSCCLGSAPHLRHRWFQGLLHKCGAPPRALTAHTSKYWRLDSLAPSLKNMRMPVEKFLWSDFVILC